MLYENIGRVVFNVLSAIHEPNLWFYLFNGLENHIVLTYKYMKRSIGKKTAKRDILGSCYKHGYDNTAQISDDDTEATSTRHRMLMLKFSAGLLAIMDNTVNCYKSKREWQYSTRGLQLWKYSVPALAANKIAV